MIERLLKHALEDELRLLVANPRKLELFLRMQNDLTQSEIDEIITYFQAHSAQVILNYPRLQEPTFPLYAIILAEERETQQFLGDELGTLNADTADDLEIDAQRGSDIFGYVQEHRFHINVMTEENPDLTLYYYQIAKAALLRRVNALKQVGLLWLRFSGRDLYPDKEYMPSHLFVRQLTIDTASLFSVIGDIPDDYFTSIDGIYVRDEPPVVGVTALVNVTNLLDNEDGD